MSTTYIVRVFASQMAARVVPDALFSAIGDVARTSMFHGGAWEYPPSGPRTPYALGALVTFEVGLSSPYAGSPEGLRRALRRAILRVCRPSMLDVELLDADRAAWYRGPEDA